MRLYIELNLPFSDSYIYPVSGFQYDFGIGPAQNVNWCVTIRLAFELNVDKTKNASINATNYMMNKNHLRTFTDKIMLVNGNNDSVNFKLHNFPFTSSFHDVRLQLSGSLVPYLRSVQKVELLVQFSLSI